MSKIKTEGKVKIIVRDKNGKRQLFGFVAQHADVEFDEKAEFVRLTAYNGKPPKAE